MANFQEVSGSEAIAGPIFKGCCWALLFAAFTSACFPRLPARAAEDGLYQRAGGIEAYIGFVPAEITQGHAATKADEPMHGGVPRGSHEYHLVVAVFEADRGARISDAMVTAQVSGLALSGPSKAMDTMTIAGTTTYGAYFELPGADLYTIVLTIKRPGATKPVTLKFTYDHRNP
jgi:hypothetical protein